MLAEPENGAVTKQFHLQSIRYLSATPHQAREARVSIDSAEMLITALYLCNDLRASHPLSPATTLEGKKEKKIIISRVAGTGPSAASAARSCCPRSDALWGLKTSSRHTSQTDRKQFKIMG